MAYAETPHGKLYYDVVDPVMPREAHHGLPFSHAHACAQALREFLTQARGSQSTT